MTVDQSIHEKLQYARQLLGHQVPSGDLVTGFGRALDSLIRELEKQKFAATERPRPGQWEPEPGERFVPGAGKRPARDRRGGRGACGPDRGRRWAPRARRQCDDIEG